jgi:disulfide oxidoreductase YuzD
MDIICTAILAATAKLSEAAIKDSYDGLKKLIQRKFGKQSDVAKAVDQLEQKPASAGRSAVLQEEILNVGAVNDTEIIIAAKALLEKLNEKEERKTIVQQSVSGNQNIFSGSGNVSVNSNQEESWTK